MKKIIYVIIFLAISFSVFGETDYYNDYETDPEYVSEKYSSNTMAGLGGMVSFGFNDHGVFTLLEARVPVYFDSFFSMGFSAGISFPGLLFFIGEDSSGDAHFLYLWSDTPSDVGVYFNAELLLRLSEGFAIFPYVGVGYMVEPVIPVGLGIDFLIDEKVSLSFTGGVVYMLESSDLYVTLGGGLSGIF